MKAHLMFADADFDPDRPEPPHAKTLIDDLGLDTVFSAMANGDRFLQDMARAALLAPLADPARIVYRQQVLADCLANEDVVRQLYALAVEALAEGKKSFWGFWHGSPSSILSGSVSILEVFAIRLRRLRALADEHAEQFSSPGFTAFFATIAAELDDAYLDDVDEQLGRLQFSRGTRFSARLGKGNKSGGFVVRTPRWRRGLRGFLLGPEPGPSYTVTVPDRDEGGSRELAEIHARALNPVANAVAQSADHIRSFFTQLQAELGFHLGCVNLHRALQAAGLPVCFPAPTQPADVALSAEGLYEVTLPLRGTEHVVGNDLDADARPLIVITGANQGGKSTFARAVALATLMACAGMTVPSATMRFSPASAVFTHFRRAEDATMTQGKFEEELARMHQIIEQAALGATVVMNESFAATNEREGAEVAVPVIRAMLDSGIRVLLVTHSFELADRLGHEDARRAALLRAQRLPDGTRPFRLVEQPPLSTSYGQDLYREVFAEDLDQAQRQP